MVSIVCSRCGVFITEEEAQPPEIVFCGNCMVIILQTKLRLANDLANAVRQNHDSDWAMPNSVMIALEKFEGWM